MDLTRLLLLLLMFTITSGQILGRSRIPRCVCNAVYRPVCGSDGKVYPNKCSAACRSVVRDKCGGGNKICMSAL